MPNIIRTIQSSLNSGEISPRLRGRLDSPRYHNALEQCTNAIPLLLGGVTRRPGTVRAGTAAAVTVRLLPFKYSSSALTGVILEFSAGKIRFYSSGQPVLSAGAPLEIVTPYLSADIADLNFEQYKNELYLFHGNYQPQVLTCNGINSWTFAPLNLTSWPFLRPPQSTGITMTTSAISGPATLTASAPFFQSGHVGTSARIKVNGGIFQITGTMDPIPGAMIAAGTMIAPIVPSGAISRHTSTFTVTFNPATMTGNAVIACITTADRTAVDLQIDCSVVTTPATLPAGISVSSNAVFNLSGGKEDVTNTTTIAAVKANLTGIATITVTVAMFRKNAAYSAAVTDWVVTILNGTSPALLPVGVTASFWDIPTGFTGLEPDLSWKEQAWGRWGWPRAGTFFDQRLFLAGNNGWPNVVWMSRIADFGDYTDGSAADAPATIIMAAASTPIVHLKATDMIYVFTQDRELTIDGGTAPLSPTNLQIKLRSNHGSGYKPAPAMNSGQIIFFGPRKTTARALSYRFDINGYIAPDLALMAEHLLQDGVMDCCYSRDPIAIFWMVTSTGKLISLTYDREQEVTAWASHELGGGGSVVSCATIIDTTGQDQVWLAVQRGSNVTVEYLTMGINLDCATIRTPITSAVWDGLSAWEGRTLTAVVDGIVYPNLTVASGQVTLQVTTGINGIIGYPYLTTIKDLPLDLTSQGTTQIGSIMGLHRAKVRFDMTPCAVINGLHPFRQTPGVSGPLPNFTGDKFVEQLGRSTEPSKTQVTIIQDQPLPLTVLAIIKEVLVAG